MSVKFNHQVTWLHNGKTGDPRVVIVMVLMMVLVVVLAPTNPSTLHLVPSARGLLYTNDNCGCFPWHALKSHSLTAI